MQICVWSPATRACMTADDHTQVPRVRSRRGCSPFCVHRPVSFSVCQNRLRTALLQQLKRQIAVFCIIATCCVLFASDKMRATLLAAAAACVAASPDASNPVYARIMQAANATIAQFSVLNQYPSNGAPGKVSFYLRDAGMRRARCRERGMRTQQALF